jgi:hypothetical protein
VLSAITALKIAPGISLLKNSGLISVINYDPKVRAFSFLYATSISLAVLSGLLLIMVLVGMLSNKYSDTKKYKILTGLLTLAVLVLSAFVIFFTSDTVITETDTDTTIYLAGNNSEPVGKTKPYYFIGLVAGITGILSAGSIWLAGHL